MGVENGDHGDDRIHRIDPLIGSGSRDSSRSGPVSESVRTDDVNK